MEKEHHEIQYFHLSEMHQMYLTMAIRSLAISTISLFIPLILLELGRSLVEVLSYQLLFPFFAYCVFLLSGKLISKIGIKHTMILSVPFFIIHYLLIYSLDSFSWPIVLLSLSAGLASGLFWFAFHIEFSKFSSKKKRGSQVGLLHSLTMSISIIGPILGGLIITAYNPQVLLLLNIVLIIISVIPLLFSKDATVAIHITPKDILYTTTPKQRISFIAEGIRSYSAVIFWPIFLFLLSFGYLVVGSVYTIVRTINTATTFFSGKYLDTHDSKKVLKVGTTIDAISLGFRAFIPLTAVTITSITSLGGVGFSLLNTSYAKIWYEKAHTLGAAFILSRELYLEIGRIGIVFFALLVFISLQIFSLPFMTSAYIMSASVFVLGAIGAIVMNIID